MGTRLSELFAGIELKSIKGDLGARITSIVIDSRRATPGCLFFALPGLRTDGGLYVDEAISRGAVAVVVPKQRQFVQAKVTFLEVENPREVLADVARRFYDKPDQRIELIGVTGTNGKSTVTHILKHLLTTGQERIGLIGTIQYDLGLRTVPSYKTTPESIDLYGMLSQMTEAGCKSAVMEVSSHGIDQQRVRGMQFAAAAFTNLTRDHLDYHNTLEDYFGAKQRLFTGATGSVPKTAAVNIDDPMGCTLIENVPPDVRMVTYGLGREATVRATEVKTGFQGTSFRMTWPAGTTAVETTLLGGYNVSNLLCAFATAYGLGYDLHEMLPRLATLPVIPGRMEQIENDLGCNVLVDYAHTDDALRNALSMLREITPGRVLAVFGCGGDRDRTKRPLMTGAVQDFADFAWATSDNPRKEAQSRIFDDMKTGVTAADRIQFVVERRRAISLALDAVRPGDSLLIAGKGHEPFQEFGDTVITFDDRQVARELIAIKSMKSSN